MADKNQKTTQAIVTSQTSLDENQKTEKFALYREDGSNLVDVVQDLLDRVTALETP